MASVATCCTFRAWYTGPKSKAARKQETRCPALKLAGIRIYISCNYFACVANGRGDGAEQMEQNDLQAPILPTSNLEFDVARQFLTDKHMAFGMWCLAMLTSHHLGGLRIGFPTRIRLQNTSMPCSKATNKMAGAAVGGRPSSRLLLHIGSPPRPTMAAWRLLRDICTAATELGMPTSFEVLIMSPPVGRRC